MHCPNLAILRVAGAYGLGPCHSTITTEPPPIVEPIHDGMLAMLEGDAAIAFLDGEKIP